MSFVLNTLVIVVLSVPLTILLGPRVRSWRHRLDGPDGFDCGWRVVHGHVPGLASRWRQGQAHVQDGRLVWRRLPWWWPQARAAALVRPAAPRGARRSMPTREQARQALQVAERKDLELYLFLRLEATTGLRPGEVCALWWQDIDLDAGELLLGHNVVHAKGLPDGYIRKRTKTRHGDDRPIAVDGRTVALLAEHRARCEARAGEWGGKLTADGYVFSADEAGRRPLRVDTVTRRFGELAEALGHGYTLYGFRHFVATQLGAVATAATIRERMGHGSLEVTGGYVHRVSEADREAARHMAELFDRPSRPS